MIEDNDNEKCMFLIWIAELDERFHFKLFNEDDEKEKNSYLAEDFSGNFIEIVDGHIYAYIHDTKPFYFLLFEDNEEFLKSIELLTFDEYQDIVDKEG